MHENSAMWKVGLKMTAKLRAAKSVFRYPNMFLMPHWINGYCVCVHVTGR